MDASQPPAKRRLLRIPQPVELVGKDEERPRFLGYLSDISLSGGFVQCSNPRDEGTRFSIRLRLPGVAHHVYCADAEVVWVRGYNGVRGRSPGMGVVFRELSTAARTMIEKFCNELDPTGALAETVQPGPVD
jgi:hypothetical protein